MHKLGEKTPWRRIAATNDKGEFRIAKLPPGQYFLHHAPHVDDRGELRRDVTLGRWRVRIEDEKHGNGEWTIVKPKPYETTIVELTLPR